MVKIEKPQRGLIINAKGDERSFNVEQGGWSEKKNRSRFAIEGIGFNEPIVRKSYFVTSALNKAVIAHDQAGYEILPDEFGFGKASSKREDVCSEAFKLGVVAHLYSIPQDNRENAISSPVHMAANKADGVDEHYARFVKEEEEKAKQLFGHEYTVADTQIVIRFNSGKKVALKKPCRDNPDVFKHDVNKLMSTLIQASSDRANIQFLTGFVKGRFGKPYDKEYAEVNTDIGKLKQHIDLNLLMKFILKNDYQTGGLDIYELKDHFVEHDGVTTRIQRYKELGYHYDSNGIFILDGLYRVHDEKIKTDQHFTHSEDTFYALLARGFVDPVYFR